MGLLGPIEWKASTSFSLYCRVGSTATTDFFYPGGSTETSESYHGSSMSGTSRLHGMIDRER